MREWGVIHGGIWAIQGQLKNAYRKYSGPFCHVPTEDSRGGQGRNQAKANALAKLLRQLNPLFDTMVAFYSAGDPELYEAARDHRVVMSEAGHNVNNWIEEDVAKILYRQTIALVQNHSVLFHNDPKDLGMTVEAVSGDFAGGDISVPRIGHRLRLRDGDLLQMDANYFCHCLGHVDGYREPIVTLNQSDEETRTHHMTDYPAGEI